MVRIRVAVRVSIRVKVRVRVCVGYDIVIPSLVILQVILEACFKKTYLLYISIASAFPNGP